MTLKEQIYAQYVDQEGLVTVEPNPGKWSTGNGAMHLGLFMCFLKARKNIKSEDQDRFVTTIKQLEVVSGLYNRNPNRPDLIAQDDLIGIAAGGAVCGTNHAEQIFNYGITHLLFWNNTDKFDIAAFRGRFPFFIAYLALMSGFYVFYPIMFIYLALSRSKNHYALLNYMKLESLATKYSGFRWLRNKIIGKINLKYATEDYFKSGHPLISLANLIEHSEV